MTDPIKLVVGLGNPGPQYEDTRHNAGVWYLDRLCRQHNAPLQADKRFLGDLARIKANGEDVWLLFPTTYMNRSGQAVGGLAKFFKIKPEQVLVAHDELDLLPGQLKLKKGGGHAGHNGLKDIVAHLGTADFWRARIGIGHPRSLNLQQGVADFVLHRPSAEQQKAIDGVLDILHKHSDLLLKGELAQATTRIHTDGDQWYKGLNPKGPA
ncbi:MAG: aminoacyl-tRNA hydrolase [Limnobacter sp.]|uniref:aminoacyl-tRNA hydrolase n=1 Tax=Limnobacter sp. TaxID=2003368 RepID=UPI00391B1FB5